MVSEPTITGDCSQQQLSQLFQMFKEERAVNRTRKKAINAHLDELTQNFSTI